MMAAEPKDAPKDAHEAERLAMQRRRSIAIAVSLGILVVLFYVATLIKMSADGDQKQPTPAAESGTTQGQAGKSSNTGVGTQ